jgi:cytochrome P450
MLHRIAARVTGIDGVDTAAGVARFRELVARIGEGASVEWSVRDHDEVIREGMAYRQEFLDEFLVPSEQRRIELVRRFRAGELTREDLPTDLLTLLHLHPDPAWDAELPWRETAFYLVAAIQTTTIAVPHVVMHLHEWTRDHPVDAARLTDPEFLRRGAVETLRLHQPAPTLLRFATRDVTLSTGRTFREGERIVLMFVPANRDPQVFGADAEEFDPHREPVDRRRPWGLTFGAGSHLCLGRTLVTGLSSRTDDDTGTDGTMVTLLSALYEAGVELVPDDVPRKTEASYHDSYERFPVLLTGL